MLTQRLDEIESLNLHLRSSHFRVLIYRNGFYSVDKENVYTYGNKTAVIYHPEALLITNLEVDMVRYLCFVLLFHSLLSV